MNVREPTAADHDRIAAVAESAMTSSYQLSPQEIERITAEQFGDDALAAKRERESIHLRVVETEADVDEPTVVGYVEGRVDEPWGTLEWLFVEPEHRGGGVGTALFEAGREALEAAGAEQLRGQTLEANAAGQEFFEAFGLEQAGDRRVEIGDETLTENVYVDPSGDPGAAEAVQDEAIEDEAALPDITVRGGDVTAETHDGRRVYLDTDDPESGEDGPFFVTYTDPAYTERFGYYCSNCGSLDVTMDSSDRLECLECGNSHATRSSEAYDGSYL
jgi:ribosomal protein S18 acetylase RimI-like enzyme